MSTNLCALRRTERLQKKNKRQLPIKIIKAKAWAVRTANLQKYSHTFKGRVGKTTCGSKVFQASNLRSVFFLRARESGNLTSGQMDVLWKNIRRRLRRFSVNFKRISSNLSFYPVLTKTQTKRSKGGRMGSGKSAVVGQVAAIQSGQILGEWKEFRAFPQRSFLEIKSTAKKISLRSRGGFLRINF